HIIFHYVICKIVTGCSRRSQQCNLRICQCLRIKHSVMKVAVPRSISVRIRRSQITERRSETSSPSAQSCQCCTVLHPINKRLYLISSNTPCQSSVHPVGRRQSVDIEVLR